MLEKLTRITVMSIEFSRQKINSDGKVFFFLNKNHGAVIFLALFVGWVSVIGKGIRKNEVKMQNTSQSMIVYFQKSPIISK
ncbi:hypothetical protein [Fructobacillus evanidus]|uniref:hypothetical protein n=1 Tax=Fructobacillus evanidus TaxID=3064281 RepID=UPI0030C8CCAB